MVKRIDKLTPEQEAAMGPFAEKWIAKELTTEPAEFGTFRENVEKVYGYAGYDWHGNITPVGSPLVVTWVGGIANYLVNEHVLLDGVHDCVRTLVAETDGQAKNYADDIARGVASAVSGVGDRTGKAVEDVLDREKMLAEVRENGHRCAGGCWWLHWHAQLAFWREVCDLELEGDLWERDITYARTQESVGWWWPHTNFIAVSDRPAVMEMERIAPSGWGALRPHCDNGPAMAWRDGWKLWFWHGTRVHEWVITDPTVEKIVAEPNTEIRRSAIEVYGWDRFVPDAGLELVKEAPDPGNPGRVLGLYDVPEDLWGSPVRLVLCVNGTPERDGTVRVYGETVPVEIDDPIAASAWGYDVTPGEYASLQRRT